VDEELPGQRNLVAGANEEGFHLLNTNIPRDYRPSLVADIALLPDGASCAACGGELALTRGVELAVVARPGALRDENAGAVYQDREGREMTVRTAQLSFHPERILLCAAGSHRDDHGLCLAPAIAPWAAHVVCLGGQGTEALAEAERLHDELSAAGLEVLFDDREESPGVKFADADLIGAPVRITVSARALKTGGVEVKARATTERSIVPRTGVVEKVRALLA
jgi:prolyl-tRNA synthetase